MDVAVVVVDDVAVVVVDADVGLEFDYQNSSSQSHPCDYLKLEKGTTARLLGLR